jgi:hypothetical protein
VVKRTLQVVPYRRSCARLADSAWLVVCSSHRLRSRTGVNLEIASFEEIARGRPILPVLAADEPPTSLAPALGSEALRWADLRYGWRLGRPRRTTCVELLRLVAGIADIDFRDLLALGR